MQFLLDLKANGHDPKALKDRSEIEGRNLLYWQAFWDLESCRATGFGVGPIPWLALDRWACRFGFDGDAFERLSRIIAAMDAVYLEHAADKMKARERHDQHRSPR